MGLAVICHVGLSQRLDMEQSCALPPALQACLVIDDLILLADFMSE